MKTNQVREFKDHSDNKEQTRAAPSIEVYENLDLLARVEKSVQGENGEKILKTRRTASQDPVKQPVTRLMKEVDEELKLIEDILSEGLDDMYRQLPTEKKAIFKAKGEETASRIKQMGKSLKLKARLVIDLIIDWLKTIPGVNTYFLKQEAKIKTDKIMRYYSGKEL